MIKLERVMSEPQKHPEGYWMNQGIAIGISIGVAIGVAIGVVLGNIAIGIPIGLGSGVGIGAAIGASLEARNKENVRPLTEGEIRGRRMAAILGIAILLLGLVVLAGVYFLLVR
jgi:hypothetical protein